MRLRRQHVTAATGVAERGSEVENIHGMTFDVVPFPEPKGPVTVVFDAEVPER